MAEGWHKCFLCDTLYLDRKEPGYWGYCPPPPLNTWIAIYESAPVSAITGAICFDSMVKGPAYVSYEIASSNKCYAVNKPGISPKELKEYLAGSKDMNVCALHVLEFNRFEAPQKISVKPPQNWGTFFVSKEEGSAE